ncbi:hypothetical protein NDN08_003795 [Rhodosorus marinus]|uniref:YggT family protein n=1 Tax=Rhodosorus marinus TaxID=101924 RepID=A0AAV8UK01_9RHOD|nr:hypothetical protein NDN08_003795 [Rhodosorus marinus]
MSIGFVGSGVLGRTRPFTRGVRKTRGRTAAISTRSLMGDLGGASMTLAESPIWLPMATTFCGIGLNIFNVMMVTRIILSWYPQVDVAKAPWIYIVVPTEPLLKGTRKVVPPVGGVDISPVIWVFFASFVQELTVGAQGILILIANK